MKEQPELEELPALMEVDLASANVDSSARVFKFMTNCYQSLLWYLTYFRL
jgi:hypothetical protein